MNYIIYILLFLSFLQSQQEVVLDRVASIVENKIVLFPGEMMHSVTPYYSTQDKRIVVSGNIDYLN